MTSSNSEPRRLGEFALIAKLFAPLAKDQGAFGLKDDAATLSLPPGEELVVTVDALNCQKDIAQTIIEGGGDYVLPVKENQPRLYEDIGRAMAKDCREETNTTWGHGRLRHNAGELDRLRQHVRPILFQSN